MPSGCVQILSVAPFYLCCLALWKRGRCGAVERAGCVPAVCSGTGGEVAGVAVWLCSAQRIRTSYARPITLFPIALPAFALLYPSPPFAPGSLHPLFFAPLTFLHFFAKAPRVVCRYMLGSG